MTPDLLMNNAHVLVAPMAAMAAFLAVLVVAWPYFARDNLDARVLAMGKERERIRKRERERLNAPRKEISLKSEPRRLFRVIVDRFNLAKQAEDAGIVLRLRMAGYRGQGPILTYLAARLLAPVVLFAVTSFYVFAVLKPDVSLLVQGAIPLVAGGLGYYVPAVFIRNRITKRQKAIRRAWPEALDLLLICVEAGMSVEGAFRKVSQEIGSQSRELAEELALTTAELSYLQDRRSAYENLGARTGLEGVRATVTSLIQSEKYGTSVAQSLRVLAQETRDMRMSEAEKKAAALPPKLTVPMILFFLPVLFAVIITPAIIQIMGVQ
jgi:tight adherence protein C